MDKEHLEKLSKPELIDLVLSLQTQIEALHQEITELKAKFSKSSKTSSKPPSTDKKPNRSSAPAKWGAKKGHKGQHFRRIESVNETIVVPLSDCPRCRRNISGQPVLSHKLHQKIGIEIRRIVTDYACEEKYCPACQANVCAPLSPEIEETHYDASIRGLANYLNGYHHIPQYRILEILSDLADIPVSKGTINTIITVTPPALEEFNEQLKNSLPKSKVLGSDETGFRVALKNFWLWVFQNPRFSYFHFEPKRSSEVIIQLIGKIFQGVLLSDFFSAYNLIECQKQKCNSHLLRGLASVLEDEPQSREFIETIFQLLLEAKDFKEQHQPYHPLQLSALIREFKKRLQDLTLQSLPPEHKQARRIQKRLQKYRHDILTFLERTEVPFDNNSSEQAIRVAVIHRKISQCFRTIHGADNFARWLSLIQTLRKQNIPVFPTVVDIFKGIAPQVNLNYESG